MSDYFYIGDYDSTFEAEAIQFMGADEVDPNSVFATTNWQSDGILGLAPMSSAIGDKYEPIVREMYEDGVLTHNRFSIHFQDTMKPQGNRKQTSMESKIWFGGVPYKEIREMNGWSYSDYQIDSKISWIPIVSGSRDWELSIKKVVMSDGGRSSQIANEAQRATVLISSGSAFNYIPAVQYEKMK